MPCVFSWLKAQRCGATLDQSRDTAICFWRVLDLQCVPYNNALHFRHGSQESVLIAVVKSIAFSPNRPNHLGICGFLAQTLDRVVFQLMSWRNVWRETDSSRQTQLWIPFELGIDRGILLMDLYGSLNKDGDLYGFVIKSWSVGWFMSRWTGLFGVTLVRSWKTT
jgi:hypothetical protein